MIPIFWDVDDFEKNLRKWHSWHPMFFCLEDTILPTPKTFSKKYATRKVEVLTHDISRC